MQWCLITLQLGEERAYGTPTVVVTTTRRLMACKQHNNESSMTMWVDIEYWIVPCKSDMGKKIQIRLDI